MSLLFGGGGQKVKPQFTGLAVQTSTSALPIPIGWGKNRASPNILWQNDFQSHKQKQKAGKGGPSTTTYTYSGSFILGLCWGEINEVTRVWKDQSKETSYAALGFTLFKGVTPQTPWGYVTTAHPTEALGYSGIAYLAVPNYDLGQSNGLAQHSFEIEFARFNTGYNEAGLTDGADPALVVQDYLTNPSFGLGFDLNALQNVFSTGAATTTGDGAFQTYCRAIGFSFSPILNNQTMANETVERWADVCNTALVWTGYSIKFHPYGPDEIDNNGVKYIPSFPIRYSLTDGDYVYRSEDPIQFSRKDPSDAYNQLSMVIANRDNEYNDLPVPWQDQGLIDQFGVRKASNVEAKEVTEPGMAAVMVVLLGQRKGYVRNEYKFVLGNNFCLLEAMDVLECFDPKMGLFTVLINNIEESDDGTFSITAEEYYAAISASGTGTNGNQPASNNPLNTSVPAGPVNPPIIFEPPSALAGPSPQVWAAVSGGNGTVADPNWGGAYVWLSTDNVTFNQVGTADHARMGKTTALLAAYGGVNPDVTNTAHVDLTMSKSDLSDAASGPDAEAGVTASYLGGEILSYLDAAPTTANNFDLASLYRGQYGTTPGSHASASNFARLDENIFKFNLPANYIGQTLYIKFQSFNIFGGGVQDLAACTVYTYVPIGAGYGTGTGGVPQTPAGFGGTVGVNLVQLAWTLNGTNDNVTEYQIWRAPGTSQPFNTTTKIATVSGNTANYTDLGVLGGSPYSYYLVAANAAGSSVETSVLNKTPTASGAGLTVWQVSATGTGASQGITLPYSGVDENGVFVYVNGLRMETTEYVISGTTLTMISNASGDAIEIIGIVT